MSQYNPAPDRKRITLLMASACVALAMCLTQCRAVDDNLLGFRVSHESAGSCLMRCAAAYNDSIRVESVLHVNNVHACASDSACLANEEIRHDAAVNRIQLGRIDCQNGCHHQGSGDAGR